MKKILFAALACLMIPIQPLSAAGWTDLSGKAEAPKVVAFKSSKTPPRTLPFIADRKREAGILAAFDSAPIIEKIGQTTVKADTATAWTDTGLWMHLLVGKDWVSLPVSEGPGSTAGAIKKGDVYFSLNANFWKSIQANRPAAKNSAASQVKTGNFMADLSKYTGTAQTPDDRRKNPFYKDGASADNGQANIVVPGDYDGNKPFGMFVYISPGKNNNGGAPGGWLQDLAARHFIYVGVANAGNDQQGEHRVWLAQQARAWALHHYKIDPNRMIISGFSNGGDAASGTAVATPFGFNRALLFGAPCEPPIGPVHIPREFGGGTTALIKPLGGGVSYIKQNWRIGFVVGGNDKFVSYVSQSAENAGVLKKGAKLFIVQGIGHDVPRTLAEYLNYLEAADDAGKGFSADSSLAEIRKNLASNPAQARAIMEQLWRNHPEIRSDSNVLSLLGKMETIP